MTFLHLPVKLQFACLSHPNYKIKHLHTCITHYFNGINTIKSQPAVRRLWTVAHISAEEMQSFEEMVMQCSGYCQILASHVARRMMG